MNTSNGNIGAEGVVNAVNGFEVNATQVIDSSKVIHGDNGGVLIRTFDQSARPTLNDNEVAFWYRNTDGVFGLLFKDGPSGNYFWVAGSNGNAASAYANP